MTENILLDYFIITSPSCARMAALLHFSGERVRKSEIVLAR